MQNRPDWEVQCEGLLQALPPEMEPICDSRGEVKIKTLFASRETATMATPMPRVCCGGVLPP